MKEIQLTPEIDRKRFERWLKQSKPFIDKLFRGHIKIEVKKTFNNIYYCETRIKDTNELVSLKVLGDILSKIGCANRATYTTTVNYNSTQSNDTPWWSTFSNTRTINHL